MRPVVGFDLDLTLVDSADAILATFREAARRLDVEVDPVTVWRQIGRPLEENWAVLVPPARVAEGVRLYRELAPEVGVPLTTLEPGAAAAVDAVRSHSGQVVVVSAKAENLVHATLRQVELDVDGVVGDVYATAKGGALREWGAAVHVGDHPGDMAGARAAGAVAVGVTTGSHDAAALREAGADVVLPDLRGFPQWLDGFVLDRRLEALDRALRGMGSVVVAFSGGADSAFLLAAAVRALGPDKVLAAT
ncbi:MAG: HAD hydrolase-like protein, partial [bacterium]